MVNARIGVLALQGDFAEHLELLSSCGYRTFQVRSAADLELADALIIPGGESTTILKMIDRHELREPICHRVRDGMPAFGTCAGAIVLAEASVDGETPLGLVPMKVRRNAYGRQSESFEADIEVPELGATVRGVFIRAPVIEDTGGGVEMAGYAGHPVLVRHNRVLTATFHPELVSEPLIHRYFIEQVCGEGV
jgi:pyridoxal 5'-phosphate synthase pdxT subunit